MDENNMNQSEPLEVEQNQSHEEGQQNEQGTEAESQEVDGEQGGGEADVQESMQ